MNFDDLSLRLIDERQPVTIFKADKVVTMDPERPCAEAVAVQHGIIVGVGELSRMEVLLQRHRISYHVDVKFQRHVIYPGFSEHHMHPHILGANLTGAHYVGYVDRIDAEGERLPGIRSKEALITRLKELIEQDRPRLEGPGTNWLNCWGFDPLLLGNIDVSRQVLDEVSTEFPICLGHASGHVINLNSLAIDISGYDTLPNDPNLPRDRDGRVTGTINEPPMMAHAIAKGAGQLDFSVEGLVEAGRVATRVARLKGCTSITDKGANFPLTPGDNASRAWIEADSRGLLSTRVNLEVWYSTAELWQHDGHRGWEAIRALRSEKRPYLSVGNLKLFADGSIQGFTANMLPDQPYVTAGKDNGQLLLSQDEVAEQIRLGEANGMSCSIHTNGNGATESVLQAIEQLRERQPNLGFRHSLEHCQLATENQFYRMAQCDVTPNLFANHIYYWGDVHVEYTVGEHLARRMDACRSATRHGLRHGIHSDDMVTEVSPLFSAWCAVNRRTLSGRVLGKDQCLSVDEAMRVITCNHAWLAHQEDVRGSIEVGKWADFTVLEEEATEDKRERLKDLRIIGTVINGDDILIN